VKLVMALRTRDQVELVDAQISFHLNAGVDFVIVTDHRSEDGTLAILEAYQREGYLRLIRETGDQVRGSEWRTRMARLAALEHGADWVIQADGDEFWWPRGSSLKAVLAPIPRDRGVVRGFLRLFPPRPTGAAFFAERMVVRIHSEAAINDPGSPFRPHAKVAHRGDPGAVVDRGAHSLLDGGLVPLHGFCPIDIFHFPVRSLEQLEWRSSVWWDQLQRQGRLGNVRARRSQEEGRLKEHYASLVVGDQELEKGLEEGTLVVDTRLRDALRSLRREAAQGPRRYVLPGERTGKLDPPPSAVVDETAHAVDVDTLSEADAVRLKVRLDELELRLARRHRLG
jgi:Glycosyl transferase family 2